MVKRTNLTAASVLFLSALLGYLTLTATEKLSTLLGAEDTKAAPPVKGQQLTGEPGSPAATSTIDGTNLPPPPPKFGGEINLNANQSKPYWPPRVVPPKGDFERWYYGLPSPSKSPLTELEVRPPPLPNNDFTESTAGLPGRRLQFAATL